MRHEAGFTLLEALVAMAILSYVLLSFLGTRTDAVIDATDARNHRLARELAESMVSELKAGARELPPESGVEQQVDRLKGFSYKFLIGEEAISEHESNEVAQAANSGDNERSDQLDWQRRRDTWRAASSRGLDVNQYEEQRRKEESEDEQVPSQDEFEDVAVVIFYPDTRKALEDPLAVTSLLLKAKISTLALSGLTPEQAEMVANKKGENKTGATAGGAGATGNPNSTAGANTGAMPRGESK